MLTGSLLGYPSQRTGGGLRKGQPWHVELRVGELGWEPGRGRLMLAVYDLLAEVLLHSEQ